LKDEEVEALQRACDAKLSQYLERRGEAIWQHRKRSGGYISGTVKYDVLKRAMFRCELCGIPATERALEVDHIKPRNKGGMDELANLQALCYSCNAMKRDRDDTDFRAVRESLDLRQDGCSFCEVKQRPIVRENSLCFAIEDRFPVTDGHLLIIPKRHEQDYFRLGSAELRATTVLLTDCRERLVAQDRSIVGFNVGVNSGTAAGQTVMHCHIHLIPRRNGDCENPRGGVRGVISGKADYGVAG
jgi:diadenosine tetraphosphate (Ap4A) HIT family hydrolase/5-methylcytosine-specific restriction endonuclease McrA